MKQFLMAAWLFGLMIVGLPAMALPISIMPTTTELMLYDSSPPNAIVGQSQAITSESQLLYAMSMTDAAVFSFDIRMRSCDPLMVVLYKTQSPTYFVLAPIATDQFRGADQSAYSKPVT